MLTLQTIAFKATMLMYEWDLTNFLQNSTTRVKFWGGLFLTLMGVALVIYGGYQVVTGLMSHGKKQVNWPIVIISLIVGGALAASGGSNLLFNIAGGGKQTITELGQKATDNNAAPNVVILSPDGDILS